MRPPQDTTESPVLEAGHHVIDRVKALFHGAAKTLHDPDEGAMHQEPTLVKIVDRITALHHGESCDVELDPHITRIGNLEKLLPLCVEQFGRTIAMREHPEGEKVILTITVTAEQSHT